jgi:hypothetical protein
MQSATAAGTEEDIDTGDKVTENNVATCATAIFVFGC